MYTKHKKKFNLQLIKVVYSKSQNDRIKKWLKKKVFMHCSEYLRSINLRLD